MNKKKNILLLGAAVIVVLGAGIGFFVLNGQKQPASVEPGHPEGMVQESEDMVESRESREDDLAIFIPN